MIFILKILGLILYAAISFLSLFISSFVWQSSEYEIPSIARNLMILISVIFSPTFLAFAFIRKQLFGSFKTNFSL